MPGDWSDLSWPTREVGGGTGQKKCFLWSLPSLKNYTEICLPLLAPILSVRSGARCWLYGSGTGWCQCKTSPTQLPDTFADKFQRPALMWKTLKQNASQKGKAPMAGSSFGSSHEPKKKGVWWHSPASWNFQQHEKCLDIILIKEEFSTHWGLSLLITVLKWWVGLPSGWDVHEEV